MALKQRNHQYYTSRYSPAPVKSNGVLAVVLIFIVFLAFLVMLALNIAWVAAAVWALVWGITDTVQSGVNFWSIAWIVMGGLGILTWLPTVSVQTNVARK